MDKESLKKDIIKDVKKNGSMSIKKIAEIYDEYMYIPRRETRAAIRELISSGVLIRVEDTDAFGNKVDDVAINE